MRDAPHVLAMWLVALVFFGCASDTNRRVRAYMAPGEYAQAAALIENRIEQNRANREYLLDRMSLGIVRLADGYPDVAEAPLLEVFDTLRTQGINDDKTVAAAVFGESGVIFWKGEPFEQALAFTYVAIQRAMRGEWDNARAAASSSLFLLKDFGENERGARKSTREIAQEAIRRDKSGEGDEYLDKGYTPVKTNFAFGYMMAGISNLALAEGDPAREDEARDHFREAFTLDPGLRSVADALTSKRANAVFVVDYGMGPRKVRYGPDGALARFSPITASDPRSLLVHVGDNTSQAFSAACDVNQMAADHMWNNFEDVRQAKSVIGQGMILGGAITAVSSRNDTGMLVGLGLILGGLLTRASAEADIRHCEVLPQRTYVAAVRIPEGSSTVFLEVAGDPGSRIALPGITAPDSTEPLRLYYVRIPYAQFAQEWALSGAVRYGNDAMTLSVPGDELPYILGGRCVRRPSARVLARYQESGYLEGMTTAGLEELYRLEGITFGDMPPRGNDGLHILEGGRWLGAPTPGSAGFVRLFCHEHPPYQPRSREVLELARKHSAFPSQVSHR